jgi:hypothetical protein
VAESHQVDAAPRAGYVAWSRARERPGRWWLVPDVARRRVAGVSPLSVAVGDFNADSRPDLAVADRTLGRVSVLLGLGDGSFGGRPTSAPAGPPGRWRSATSTATRPPTWRSRTPTPETSRCWSAGATAASAGPRTSPPARPYLGGGGWRSETSTATRAPTWRSPTSGGACRCCSAGVWTAAAGGVAGQIYAPTAAPSEAVAGNVGDGGIARSKRVSRDACLQARRSRSLWRGARIAELGDPNAMRAGKA